MYSKDGKRLQCTYLRGLSKEHVDILWLCSYSQILKYLWLFSTGGNIFYINEPWANLMVKLFIVTAPLVVSIFWISCLSHGCDKMSDKDNTRCKGLTYWPTFPRDNPLWTGTVVRGAFAIEAGVWGSWLCFLCGQDEGRDEELPTVRSLFSDHFYSANEMMPPTFWVTIFASPKPLQRWLCFLDYYK